LKAEDEERYEREREREREERPFEESRGVRWRAAGGGKLKHEVMNGVPTGGK
jgi:hypothetical protein